MRAVKANRDVMLEYGCLRTPNAHAALLRIAYGEIGAVDAVFAGDVYASSLTNRAEARALLAASQAGVVAMGLRVLPGQPVDASLLDRLAVILQWDSARLRYLAADVLAGDPLKGNARRKAELVLESMKTTLQCRDAEVRVGGHPGNFHHLWRCAEISLVRQASALARICDTIPEFLLEMDLPEQGCAHDLLGSTINLSGEESDTLVRPRREPMNRVGKECRAKERGTAGLVMRAGRNPLPMAVRRYRSSGGPYPQVCPAGGIGGREVMTWAGVWRGRSVESKSASKLTNTS